MNNKRKLFIHKVNNSNQQRLMKIKIINQKMKKIMTLIFKQYIKSNNKVKMKDNSQKNNFNSNNKNKNNLYNNK